MSKLWSDISLAQSASLHLYDGELPSYAKRGSYDSIREFILEIIPDNPRDYFAILNQYGTGSIFKFLEKEDTIQEWKIDYSGDFHRCLHRETDEDFAEYMRTRKIHVRNLLVWVLNSKGEYEFATIDRVKMGQNDGMDIFHYADGKKKYDIPHEEE